MFILNTITTFLSILNKKKWLQETLQPLSVFLCLWLQSRCYYTIIDDGAGKSSGTFISTIVDKRTIVGYDAIIDYNTVIGDIVINGYYCAHRKWIRWNTISCPCGR